MQKPPIVQLSRRDVLAVTAAGLMPVDPDFRGRISPADAQLMRKREGISADALMLKLLPVAKSQAHPPLSNYFVGAVALGRSGSLYLGANIEVPGNILGLAVHAEQAAIANAYMAGESGIDAIAVTAAPCGHCRQFLSELALESLLRVLINDAPAVLLSDLLPKAFGPRDLGFKDGALPVRRAHVFASHGAVDQATTKAIEAASQSYSPYTQSPSGAAIVTGSGKIYAGSYIENAAFNPSLPPLQTALAGYFAAGKKAGAIEHVVLAEGRKNKISQESAARSTLLALAPSATFRVVGL